jgi:hypothetical protein
MSAAELWVAAAAEVREADRADLAEAASHTAYLLGVLRQVDTELGLRPPHQVLVGLQGLRRWSLQLRNLDGPPEQPARDLAISLPTASDAATE